MNTASRSKPKRWFDDLALATWLNVPAKLAGTALSFLLYVGLARWMSVDAFGQTALMLAWLAIASVFASLSMPLVVVRHVAADLALGRIGRAKGAFRFALRSVTAASVGVAAGAIGLAMSGAIHAFDAHRADVVVTALLLVPSALVLVRAGLLQALKRVVSSEVLTNAMRPALMLAIVGIVHVTAPELLSSVTVLGAYFAVTLVLLATLAFATRRALPPGWTQAPHIDVHRDVLRTAMGFMTVMLTAALSERVDLLLLGWTASSGEVAAYAVATRFSQATTVAINAMSAVMAPHFVEQLSNIRDRDLMAAQRLIRGTARRTLVVTVMALLAFGALGPWLTSLFGPQYRNAYLPLVLLTIGQVVASTFGPATLAATLAGSSGLAVSSMVAGLVVNTLLNLLLVPHFGSTGAAAASAVATTTAAILAWYRLRRRVAIDSAIFAVLPRRASFGDGET